MRREGEMWEEMVFWPTPREIDTRDASFKAYGIRKVQVHLDGKDLLVSFTYLKDKASFVALDNLLHQELPGNL